MQPLNLNFGSNMPSTQLAAMGTGGYDMGVPYMGGVPNTGLSMGAPVVGPNTVPMVRPQPRSVNGAPVVPAAAAGAGTGFWGKIGGMEGVASIADGLASLGQLYGAIQSVKLAKEQLGLQREAFQTNLANQKKSYNTALEDRIQSRYVMEGKSQSDAQAYLDKNRL